MSQTDDTQPQQPILRSFPVGSQEDTAIRTILQTLAEQAEDRDKEIYDDVLAGRRGFADLQDIDGFRTMMAQGSERAAESWRKLDPNEKLRLIDQAGRTEPGGAGEWPGDGTNDDEGVNDDDW